MRMLQANQNSNCETEQSEGDTEEASINSDSRTKTAMFSQNEGSAGVFNRMLESRGVMANESKDWSTEETMQEPPGFERRVALSQDPSQVPERNANNCVATPNSSLEPKDVQEDSYGKNASKVDNIDDGTEKITKCSKGIKAKETQQCSCNSAEDSIQKITKEVDRIGKILGLTVVQNANRPTSLKTTKKTVHRVRPPKCGKGTQQ